jgi:hypothetical protein
VSQQRELQRRSNMICSNVAVSCSATFVALFLTIDVSHMLNSAAIAMELRGALQHHPQHFLLDFRLMSIGFSSDCPASLAIKVLPTSLFASSYCRLARPAVWCFTSCRPNVLCTTILQSCVLRSAHCGRASCAVVSYNLSCCILTYYRPVIREIQTIHCVRIL